ncbi:uncharacterized protein LAESUDRAFT_651052 [Laetiporus sulphureus 93-53]|uniref:Telomerase reverse transcriptase n=1 Tax=Laetiporus sulphureus 93-53 TaxID=1314785 RepID=A0A165EU85_9APHY|nr:uncharacterized protein LAESUDRAFT_651052 [Laetiporus sulphureus 93-53]KZT07773.1 hypothetical protein LAESUDRAFT_651052 [Laetiporus sulphureus 93-53]
MKMHHYLRQWGINVKKHNKFIQNTVQRMLKYTYTTMRNKATNRVAKASGGRCEVSEVQVIWLGTHAFFTVFSRKPHAYPQLVAWLQFQLSLPRNQRLKKQFNGIVKDGLQTLTLLSF